MGKKLNVHVANDILQKQRPNGVKSWGELKERNYLEFEPLKGGSRLTTKGVHVNTEWLCVLKFLGVKFTHKSVRKREAEDAVAKQFVEHLSSSPPN